MAERTVMDGTNTTRIGAAGIALAAVLAIGLPAQEQKGPARAEPGPAATPGEVLEWTDSAGKPYWYRLPKGFAPNRPVTLTFMLHGTGLKWGWAFWNYPIAKGGFRGEDIVVAPEAMTPAQGGVFNFIQGKADGDHLADLVAWFKKRFQIQRVYVYGHSQGAFFSYWFAGEHPELVDGIVAHAGNLLADVKHPPLAKDKVAIGILHARADAVVPVDCAFATERAYKALGYKKLKLKVVDGLTEQSGHWPLPAQAAEMFAWLDSVSSESPASTMASAISALGHETPDLAVAVEALAKAGRQMKAAAKLENRDLLVKEHAELTAWLDDLAKAHAAAVMDRPDSRKADAPYGAQLVHFRVVNAGLDAWPGWQATLRDLRTRAASHDKLVQSGLDKLLKVGAKDAADLQKPLQDGFLAAQYETFAAQVERAIASPPKGSKADDLAKLKAVITARAATEAAGKESATKLTLAHVATLRAAHPEWFPPPPAGE